MDSRVTPPKRSWFSWLCSLLQSPLLLAIRLIWGIFFVYAGVAKLGNMEETIQFFEKLQIPYAEWNAWAVALTETIGGALLVVGLFTRLFAIPLSVVMIVALITAHSEPTFNLLNDFQAFMNEKPFYFLLATLTLVAFGPGWFSLDSLWRVAHKKAD